METVARPNCSFHRWAQRVIHHHQAGWSAVLLGFAVFALLWILYTPYRDLYMPNTADIPALADGLLLAPGAHWTDWFTRGYSNFWNAYPEWPFRDTGFTRPAFQFLIYLAHFALGRNWELYSVISCLVTAAVAAVAFLIARTALGLRIELSLLATALVVLSPPVLEHWVFGLAFAIEFSRYCLGSGRLSCSCRATRPSLSYVSLCRAVDQRKRRMGANRSGHNRYAAAQS